jgi:hypothetical protein
MILAATARLSSNSVRSIETAIPRDGTDLTGEISTAIHDGYDHDRGSGLATQASAETRLGEGSSQSVWSVGVTLSYGGGFSAQYGGQECTMS